MAYDISKVLSVAQAEIGYLEKKSNADLDSKTGNAGSNNYTKYWRDLNASGYQRQPWCNAFVNWCFIQAYGEAAAKQLLCTSGGWSYYTPTSAGYFKNKGQWYTSPQAGDVIYFKSGSTICHVGIVYAVSGSNVTTIEGNTSGAATVVANGGGVFKKSYAKTNSRIAGYGRPNYGTQSSSSTTSSTTTTKTTTSTTTSTTSSVLKKGSSGSAVKTLQTMLIKCGYSCGSAGADGDFGSGTESALKKFQAANGLTADGIYGPASKAKLEAVYANAIAAKTTTNTTATTTSTSYSKTQFVKDVQSCIGVTVDGIAGPKTLAATVTISKSKNSNHKVVLPVQKYLNALGYSCGTADGSFGSKTDAAVKKYQSAKGCTADGEITAKANTWKKLLGLA